MQKIRHIGLTQWEYQHTASERDYNEMTAPINYQNLLYKDIILKLTDAYANGKEGKEIRLACIQTLNKYCARVFETAEAIEVKSVSE